MDKSRTRNLISSLFSMILYIFCHLEKAQACEINPLYITNDIQIMSYWSVEWAIFTGYPQILLGTVKRRIVDAYSFLGHTLVG